MREFIVKVPVKGIASVRLNAKDPDEAKQRALENWSTGDVDQFDCCGQVIVSAGREICEECGGYTNGGSPTPCFCNKGEQ
ncbi:MAG: hypothetical protein WC911_03630 [Thermoleophilia bacterium]